MKTLHWIWRPDECERLLEAVDSEDRLDYILMTDRTGHNSLQTAILDDNLAIADLILRYIRHEEMLERVKAIQCRDENGNTLLNLCQSGDMVRLILDRLTPNLQQKLILTTNYSQQTAVHRAAIYGQTSVVEAVMEYATEENVKHLLTCQDSINFNLLIWSGYGGHKQTIRLVIDLLHDNDLLEASVSTCSLDKETVTHFINGRQYTEELVYLMKYLSLEKRRALFASANGYGYTPHQLCVVPHSKIREKRNALVPDYYHAIMLPDNPINNDMLRVINLLMNEYSIISPGAIIQLGLSVQSPGKHRLQLRDSQYSHLSPHRV